jgi:Transposase
MPYPPETRAAVVAAVLAGESVNKVSKRFGIGRATIVHWRDLAERPPASPALQQKKEALGEQVYGLLEDSIAALRFQLRATSNEAWIRAQSADQLAIFYGVLADKAIRLLAAIRPSGDDAHTIDPDP